MERATGLNRYEIHRWETGDRPPLSKKCIKIANALQIDPQIIFDLALKAHIKDYVEEYQYRWQKVKKTGIPLRGPCTLKSFKYRDRRLNKIANLVKDARQKMGASREKVAEETGLCHRYIGLIENGQIGIEFHKLQKLFKYLKLNPDYMINILMWESIKIWTADMKEYFAGLMQDSHFPVLETQTKMGLKRYPPINQTETGDYLYLLRQRSQMAASVLGEKLSIYSNTSRNYEEGMALLTFDTILRVANFSGDSPEDIFKMTLRDRIMLYRKCHRSLFEEFINNDPNENMQKEKRFGIYFSDRKTKRTLAYPIYLRSSEYLKKGAEKKGWTANTIATMIGISSYTPYKRGQRSMTFLLIDGCSRLFGDDPHDLFEMILQEQIDCLSMVYICEWNEFRRLHQDEIDRLEKTHRLQMA